MYSQEIIIHYRKAIQSYQRAVLLRNQLINSIVNSFTWMIFDIVSVYEVIKINLYFTDGITVKTLPPLINVHEK